MTLITTQNDLLDFCASLHGADFLAIDTEFLRERTYWPKLCLLQVAGPRSAAAIDPLAPGLDLKPFLDILYRPDLLKVVHAGRQDVEIFVKMTGRVPTPLFDTQIAAQVLGQGEAASYEQLAGHYAHAKIDKSSRFTDWSRRPLTEKQIDYAMADVTHLRVVYQKMLHELDKRGRRDWITEEMAAMHDVALYQVDPETVWEKLRVTSTKPMFVHLVKKLAAWREKLAQRADVPRQRIMRDETLLEICHHTPHSVAELEKTRGLQQGFAGSDRGQELLHVIHDAMADALPPERPERPVRRKASTQAALELLRVLLKHVAEDHDVAPRMICSGEELEDFVVDPAAEHKLLQGWRGKIFGGLAQQLMRGEISLKLHNGRVVIG